MPMVSAISLALEHLVRHHPARLVAGAEDSQAHVVTGDQGGQVAGRDPVQPPDAAGQPPHAARSADPPSGREPGA
jgi:hypothetical protein